MEFLLLALILLNAIASLVYIIDRVKSKKRLKKLVSKNDKSNNAK